MLDHLAFDDDTAPHFAAAYHYTIVDPHPLVQAYADAIDRMIGALMGTEPAARIDAKPAVAGLLSETPAGRYRGIGWCDGA